MPSALFLKENGCGYIFLIATLFKHHEHSPGLQSDDFTILQSFKSDMTIGNNFAAELSAPIQNVVMGLTYK